MPEDTSKYVMRCHYDVLELEDRKADEDEIRRNYKKLCLKLHPDKNRENIEEATMKFKEVQNSYAVLIDPDERAWYDNHREKILRGSDPNNRGNGGDDDDSDGDGEGPEFLNLWKFFGRTAYTSTDDTSAKGFFGVFNTVFDTIFEEDNEWLPRGSPRYPAFGDAETDWLQVNQFYQFWQSYSTKKSYAWKDEYKINELPDRQMRRAAEKINAGHREAAKREYSRTVQSLVDQVRRTDPRVEAEQRRIEARMKIKDEEREKKQDEALRRRAEERKRWTEEAEQQEKESMVSIAEETEVLEQLYAMRTSNKPKQPPKQPQTPLYTKDEHGNDIKIVPAEDDDDEDNKKKTIFKCEHCKKTVNSQKLFDEHCNSAKHKTVLKKLGINPKTMKKFGEADENGDDESVMSTAPSTDGLDKKEEESSTTKATSSTAPSPAPKGKKAVGKKEATAAVAAAINAATAAATASQKTATKGKKRKAGDSSSSSSSDDEEETSPTQQTKQQAKKQQKKAQAKAVQAKAKQSQQMKSLPTAGSSSSDESSSSSDDDEENIAPATPTFQTGSSKKKKR